MPGSDSSSASTAVEPMPIGDEVGPDVSPASWESLTPSAAILNPSASRCSQKSIAVTVNGLGPWPPRPAGPVATSIPSTFE